MSGIDAFGTKLKRGDGGSPEVFTALASVTDISGPGLSREILDMTAHDSPDGWREKKGGLRDGGEVSVDINYDPSVHNSLVADLNDADPRNYQLEFPDSPPSTWTFKAILKGFEPGAPHDDKLTASVTFDVSGKPTIP